MTCSRLEGRTPVPSDVATWTGWVRTADRANDAPPDRFRQCYATWKAAELGHVALVERYSREP